MLCADVRDRCGRWEKKIEMNTLPQARRRRRRHRRNGEHNRRNRRTRRRRRVIPLDCVRERGQQHSTVRQLDHRRDPLHHEPLPAVGPIARQLFRSHSAGCRRRRSRRVRENRTTGVDYGYVSSRARLVDRTTNQIVTYGQFSPWTLASDITPVRAAKTTFSGLNITHVYGVQQEVWWYNANGTITKVVAELLQYRQITLQNNMQVSNTIQSRCVRS